MENFFIKYVNTLPYSSIIDFINYEKLENKDDIKPPLYSTIESIQSLLLDRIESLKTEEEIAECLKQYLNKNYIDENNSLKEVQYGLPQDITDEDFFRRYPNTLNLSDLLDYLNGNVIIFENQESVNTYIQNVINNLLTVTDPLTIYQEMLAAITE
jgi:HEPN domain-containing protein